ncbi:MAG: tetratricopeptide repeat protein [Kofleriaceae bacterium]
MEGTRSRPRMRTGDAARMIACGLAIAIAACGRPPPLEPLPPLPAAAYSHYIAGKLAANRDDWSAAVDALAAAAVAAPDEPMIVVELARAQVKAKRPTAARQTLAAARARWPNHSVVWLASGDLFGASARVEAIAAYRRAIALDRDDERGYLGLARLETPQAAEATLRRLISRVPDSVDGHYRLAQRLESRGELASAIARLKTVIELDPDHIDGRLDLARALRRIGHIEQAIEQTRSAFDRTGQAIDVAEELFWLLCEADDYTAAIDLLTLLDDDRSDGDALAVVARLHRGLGRFEDARAIASKLSVIEPDLGELTLAEIELAEHAAAAAAQRALQIKPSSSRFSDARRVAAEALLAAGDPPAATAALAPAREADPDNADLVLIASYANADAGDVAGARALVATLGNTTVAMLARARLEDRIGASSEALAILEPLIRAKPNLPSALNLAGYLLADRNQRLNDAERWLRRARELAPGDPAILDSWGWLLLRRGNTREAVRVLDRASRFAPHEPEILLHLATAWAADRAPRTAISVLDRAITMQPTAQIKRRIDALRASLPGV